MILHLSDYTIEVKGEELIVSMSSGREASSGEKLELIKLMAEFIHNKTQYPEPPSMDWSELQLNTLYSAIMTSSLFLGPMRLSSTGDVVMALACQDGDKLAIIGNLCPTNDVHSYYQGELLSVVEDTKTKAN